MLNEGVKIRGSLMEVEWQIHVKQAVPNPFGCIDITGLTEKIYVVQDDGRTRWQRQIKDCAVVARRPCRKRKNIPRRDAVPEQYFLEGLQSLGYFAGANVEIGDAPVYVRRIREELLGAIES